MSRESEYQSLRAELLSLGERAFKAWRWGLAELAALVWVVLIASFEILKNRNGFSVNPLPDSLKPWVVIAIFFLFSIGLSILAIETKTIFTLVKGADRIGGYLAVFHDLPLVNTGPLRFGWHVWNRIEKEPEGKEEKLSPQKLQTTDLPPRAVYVVEQLRVYVAALVVYLLVLIAALATVFSIAFKVPIEYTYCGASSIWGPLSSCPYLAWTVVGVILSLTAIGIFWWVVERLRKKSRRIHVEKTRRWGDLFAKACSNPDDIKEKLPIWGLDSLVR